MPKTRRLQVLIEDEQWSRLEAAAAERGASVGAVVREAIDAAVPGGRDERQEAGRSILAAERMPVPHPAALRDELDGLRGRRT